LAALKRLYIKFGKGIDTLGKWVNMKVDVFYLSLYTHDDIIKVSEPFTAAFTRA
jgi:hypothetical protein